MSPETQLSLQMPALRQRFIARARADVNVMREQCQRLLGEEQSDAPRELKTMSSLLHRLSGTAGTFGASELGHRATQLHSLVRSLSEQAGPLPRERLSGLADALEHLELALHLAPSETATQQDPSAPRQQPSPLVHVVSAQFPFAQRVCQVLEGFGYRVDWFSDITELETRPGLATASAVLLKLDSEGAQLQELKRVRAAQADPVPTIIVAEKCEFVDYLQAVRAGADGYFMEPVDLPRLEARLNYLIERSQRDGLRVLLVDDDEDILAACRNILEKASMIVEAVSDPTSALAALAQFRPEVILMDIQMPECSGPELAQIVRLNEEWLHVPIVYMSTQSEGADQLRATRKAGEAFISKPIDAKELIATVIANGRHARQMLETASRDTLTGLLKHSFIKELLGAELERAQRAGGETCAVVIDLDHFKSVNDRYGHLVGDLVIRTLSNLLRQRLRVIDGIGRLGGEEFLAVLVGCGCHEAVRIMEFVRQRFGDIEFNANGEVFHVTFSAGIARPTGYCRSPTEVLDAADRALYRAKSLGRNRVFVEDSETG